MALGKPGATDQEIAKAAKAANAHEVSSAGPGSAVDFFVSPGLSLDPPHALAPAKTIKGEISIRVYLFA